MKPVNAGIFDRVDFDHPILRRVESFCAFPRLGGKVYVYSGPNFRESIGLENDEQQKTKIIEIVKAVFMILLFPVTALIYGAQSIIRAFTPEKKVKAPSPSTQPIEGGGSKEVKEEISKQPPCYHYGRSRLTEEERADFNRDHLERIIRETPPLPTDENILQNMMISEFAGWQTEILPGLVVGGLHCQRGINYGYPEGISNYFSSTEKVQGDFPALIFPMGEEFDARASEEGIFDVLVTTNTEWERKKIKGKTAPKIYLKEGGKQIFGFVDSQLFDRDGTDGLKKAVIEATEAWKAGDRVVVQCAQGCDRSVTFIICMLYHMTKMDSSILIDFVNRKRSIANRFESEDNITDNFRRALEAFA